MNKLKNRAAAAILAAALSVSSYSQALFAIDESAMQADTAADSTVLSLNEKTYARYSSVRIEFTPESGHTYRIQKKDANGSFSDLEGADFLTTGSFIDENAGTGKEVTYKIIDMTDPDAPRETEAFTSKQTSLKSLAEISILKWIDPREGGTSTVFDGTNVISIDAPTTANAAALSKGTVLAKVHHTGTLESGGGAFLGIKSGSADRFFGYRNANGGKAVFGFELTNQNKCQCLGTNANDWNMAAGSEGHTVIYRGPSDCVNDRLTYFYDGQDGLVGATSPDVFKNADFNGFLTKTTLFDTLSIGGVKDSSGNVSKAWKGEIDYVLITSELLSEAECQAISLANEDLSDQVAVTPDPGPEQPDPEEVTCTVKAGVFKNTISWNGSATATITRDGTVIAADVTSPYVDKLSESAEHTYKVTVGSGENAREFNETVDMGVQETAVLYHNFSKDSGDSPMTFNGSRIPYNLLENADDALKTKVGNIAGGGVMIRFKSNTRSDAYSLWHAHKAGVYARTNWPNANPVGSVEGYVTGGKLSRFDLTGTAIAQRGTVADGRWHTIIFANTDSAHVGECPSFSVTMDGGVLFNYTGSDAPALAYFLTRLNGAADELLIGGARAAAGDEISAFRGLFNGEIEFAALLDENLTQEELNKLTSGDMLPLTKQELIDASGNKHWVAVGGGLASAGNDVLGYRESYYKIFHLGISLDNEAGGGYAPANFKRQRYVLNRSKPGNTIQNIDTNYADLIDKYGPRAVMLMLDGNEELSDQQTKDSLKSILKKNLDAKRYTLIQIPPVKGAASRDLKALVDAVIAADYAGYPDNITVVDHEALFQAAGEDEKCFTADGVLNARGHQMVADQSMNAIGLGNVSSSTPALISKYSFTPLASLKEDTPIFVVSDDSVTASIQSDGIYTAVLEMNGQKTAKPFVNKSVIFNGLEQNTPFEFTVENQDGAVVYKKQTGRTGQSTTSEKVDYTSTSDLQKVIQQYATRDEQTTWLFIGDSITHGVRTAGFTGVPDAFERYIHDDLNRPNDMIINTAISNADFDSYNLHKDERYDRWKDEADVVICMLGTNDGAYAENESLHHLYQNFYSNLSNAVKEWKADGKEVVLRVPPKIVNQAHAGHTIRNDDIHRWVLQVAEEQNCIVADHFELYDEKQKSDATAINTTGFWFSGSDGIHPCGPGQIAMVRQVIDVMGLYDSDSRLVRQDIAEPINAVESLKSIAPVWNESTRTISYDLSALEAQMSKTIGKADLVVEKGDTVISKELIRKNDSSLGTISVNASELNGEVSVRVVVRPTDAWSNSKYTETTVAKTTLDLGGETEDNLDLRALQTQVEAASAFKDRTDTALPEAWKTALASKVTDGQNGLNNSSSFASQGEVDALTAQVQIALALVQSASEAYKAIDQNADLDLDGYTAESADAYTAAKSALEAALSNPSSATKKNIDDLKTAYLMARENLAEKQTVPSVDTILLQTLITDIDRKGSLDAFADKNGLKAQLNTALIDGRTALNAATQGEVDAATARLSSFWLSMRYQPDSDRLANIR